MKPTLVKKSSYRLNVLILGILIALLISNCQPVVTPTAAPEPTKVEVPTTVYTEPTTTLTVLAELEGTNNQLTCEKKTINGHDGFGPFCQDLEGKEPEPITFIVCDKDGISNCFNVKSGESKIVPSDGIIKAPDGRSRGEQIGLIESDVYLGFSSWLDNNSKDNPRKIAPSGQQTTILADYAYFEIEANISRPLEAINATKIARQRGCSSITDADIWSTASPEWVYAGTNSDPVEISGIVTDSHPSNTDLYTTHYSYDWIFYVDIGHSELLSRKGNQLGERPNQIQVEWESGSFPMWSRPNTETGSSTPGEGIHDWVWVKGMWVYDCGHESDDIEEGAWTEIHPPVAVATVHDTQNGHIYTKKEIIGDITDLSTDAEGFYAIEADVWINGDGGGATDQLNKGNPFSIKDVYEFSIPLPTKPTELINGEPKYRYNFLGLKDGQPKPEVELINTNNKDELRVRIDLRNYSFDNSKYCKQENYGENLQPNCRGQSYGVKILWGWEINSLPQDLHDMLLNLSTVEIYKTLDCVVCGNGEYKIWANIGPRAILAGNPDNVRNNSFIALHELAPKLYDTEASDMGVPHYLVDPNDKNLTLLIPLRIRENLFSSNYISILTDGREYDPGYSDAIGTINRLFYKDRTIINNVLGSERCWGTWDPNRGSGFLGYEDFAIGGAEPKTYSLVYNLISNYKCPSP